jgi:predicted nuclease of predicted toxin-antitoxin system
MKLLLDENLSRRVIPFILDNYQNSTQVALIGLEKANDRTIWEYAIENDYVITTRDADFYEMSILLGQPPKILWLRTNNQTKAETIRSLVDNQEAIEYALFTEKKACIELE